MLARPAWDGPAPLRQVGAAGGSFEQGLDRFWLFSSPAVFKAGLTAPKVTFHKGMCKTDIALINKPCLLNALKCLNHFLHFIPLFPAQDRPKVANNKIQF